jgi:hypothetical protein
VLHVFSARRAAAIERVLSGKVGLLERRGVGHRRSSVSCYPASGGIRMVSFRLVMPAVLGVALVSPSLPAMVPIGDAEVPAALVPAPISFDVPVLTPAPDGAVDMLSADLDADGQLDLALVTSDGDVYVALNPGAGDDFALNWQLAASVQVGVDVSFSGGLRAADVDADGLPELVAFGRPRDVYGVCLASVLSNLGGGFFGPGEELSAVPERPDDIIFNCNGLELGDFDRNGVGDLALSFSWQAVDSNNGLDTSVSVFLGAADGSHGAPRLHALADDPLPYASFAMTSGDFDGDGVIDLGFGSEVRWLSGPTNWRVETLRGDGAGGFTPGTVQAFDCDHCELTEASARDFDGDGRDELVIAATSPELGIYDYPVLFFQNAGDGSFAAARVLLEHAGTVGLDTHDLTHDGNADVLLLGEGDQVTLLEGLGDGSFGAPQRFAPGTRIATGLVADLNADGAEELVLLGGDYNAPPSITVVRGLASERLFQLPQISAIPGGYIGALAAPADFDGDGVLDQLVFGPESMELMLGTGDGRFVPGGSTPNNPHTPTSDTSPWPAPVVDVDHDGRLDVIQAAADGYAVAFGNADGTFSATAPVTGSRFPGNAAVGDINGDGVTDLAVSEYPGDSVDIYFGDATFGFSLAGRLELQVYSSALYLEDLNSDGQLDLFVAAAAYGVPEGAAPGTPASQVWLGNGSGGFTAGASVAASGSGLLLRDVNADGRLDALSATSLSLGNGDGTFSNPQPLPASGGQFDVADLDEDGHVDLLYTGDALYLARGRGDGTFQAPERLMGTSGWLSFRVARWAGTPAPDLLVGRYHTTNDTEFHELALIENLAPEACRAPTRAHGLEHDPVRPSGNGAL